MPKLSKDVLDSLLAYDPTTGHFTWKRRAGSRALPGMWAGSVNEHGYMYIVIHKVSYRRSRLVWLHMTGEFPSAELEVDHINGKKSDDRWENLRLATRQENVRNLSARGGARGTTFVHATGKWQAQICHNYRKMNLGTYATQAEAHAAYVAKRRELGFHELWN